MIGVERWRNNLVVVSPANSVRVDLQRFTPQRNALKQRIRDLPPGTPVVLVGSAPGAIRRCRRFAAKTGIELDREYLALPSARAPAYLVEDVPAPVRRFVKTVLVAPPGIASSLPMQAGLSLVRALGSWRLMRTVAPGRVVVGRRV